MTIDLLSVGEAANELTAELGETVRPRWISTLCCDKELREDRCPLIGGRRLIARGYLPEIVRALRRRGWIGRRQEPAS